MPTQEPRVLLCDDSGHRASGRLLGLTQDGGDGRVCVILDEGQGVVLALGAHQELELTRSEGAPSLRLRTRVLQHRVGRDAGWYVFEIDERDRHLLASGTNRRQHLRGRAGPRAAISASLSAPDGSLSREVRIKDLSEGGAALLVSPPEDLELLAQSRLRVAFRLAEGEPEVEVLARLVFRRQGGPVLHYGLAFDPLATPGFDEVRTRLAAWVRDSQDAEGEPLLFAFPRVG